MVILIMVVELMIRDKDMVFINDIMMIYMKGNEWMIRCMGKDNYLQVKIIILKKVFGLMISSINILIDIYI